LNLFGNQTVHSDPAIRLAHGWVPNNPDLGLTDQRASEASRGMHQGRFPIEALVARGFALVTAYVGDIDPDFDDGFHNGVHAFLPPSKRQASDSPGTLSAWAWGLSRLREALNDFPRIDRERLVVFGHSRLGKAALWAAAQDEAFALAISNESGCGGATLSRRCFGERLLHINRRFPHWFCPAFHAYNDREHELPVDQHQLLALLAPRPVYVASAAGDLWADPLGEQLACEAASPVYTLFGARGFGPAKDDPRAPSIGYHVRPGRHDIIARDFWHYLAFAETHLGVGANATRVSA
jgi:(4-O-methyl)-D-glucuronate---lignin esterase